MDEDNGCPSPPPCEEAEVVFCNLDLLQQVLRFLNPIELAHVAPVNSLWRNAVSKMPSNYWLHHYTAETSLRQVPEHLNVQSWKAAFLAAKFSPDLAPARFESRFHVLVGRIRQWRLTCYGRSHAGWSAVSSQYPTQIITNRQSLWIRFCVPRWLKDAQGPHKVVLSALDEGDWSFQVIEDASFRWPQSDTDLMEMSHTTGLYPWDPETDGEGLLLMAYVHFEQLIPALFEVHHGQCLPLPCHPSPLGQAFASHPPFKILLDFNTVEGQWLGRMEAQLVGSTPSVEDFQAGYSLRLEGKTAAPLPSACSPPPVLLFLPRDPDTPPSPSSSSTLSAAVWRHAVTDPLAIRAALDRICGETECMVDFSIFDVSATGRGSLLVGRSGCEIWRYSDRYEAPFLAPGQAYSDRSKVLFFGTEGSAGVDQGVVVGYLSSADTYNLLVRDVEDRFSSYATEMGRLSLED